MIVRPGGSFASANAAVGRYDWNGPERILVPEQVTLMKPLTAAIAILTLGLSASTSFAQAPAIVPVAAHQEPGWLGVIIARGELREQIEATPILDRPYRPLHVYGNTVRRNYYRGAPGPRVRDVGQGAGSLIVNR
jgi:hypothetical protein